MILATDNNETIYGSYTGKVGGTVKRESQLPIKILHKLDYIHNYCRLNCQNVIIILNSTHIEALFVSLSSSTNM